MSIKRLKIALISGLVLLSALLAHAESSIDEAPLNVSEKVSTIWLKYVQTAQANPNYENISAADLRDITTPYLREMIEAELLAADPKEKNKIATVVSKVTERLDWEHIKNFLSNKAHGFKTGARLNGVALQASVILGFAAKYVAFTTFTKLGYYKLALLSASGPLAATFPTTVLAYQYIRERQNMIKLFGSRKAYKEYLSKLEAINEELKMNTVNDRLMPILLENENFVISVANHYEENLLKKLKITAGKKLGFYESAVEMSDLMKFCKEEEYGCSELEKIKALPNLSKAQKTILGLTYLESNMTTETAQRFKTKMQASLTLAKYDKTSAFAELANWSIELQNAKTIGAVFTLVDKIPENLAPSVVVEIWNQIGIPSLSEKSNVIGLKSFRKLVKGLDALKVTAAKDHSNQFSDQWKKLFKTYLTNALQSERCLESF